MFKGFKFEPGSPSREGDESREAAIQRRLTPPPSQTRTELSPLGESASASREARNKLAANRATLIVEKARLVTERDVMVKMNSEGGGPGARALDSGRFTELDKKIENIEVKIRALDAQ